MGLFALACIGVTLYTTQDLSRTTRFGGDQGRTALVLRAMHEVGEVPLLGPRAGFGGCYFGPAYYFLLYLPYRLAGFDPLAGAFFTAALNLSAIALLLWHLSEAHGWVVLPLAGLVAYALAPFNFEFLRTEWNPYLLPGVLSLFLFAAVRYHAAWRRLGRCLWGAAMGAAAAVGLQLHTTAFPLALALAFVLGHDLLRRKEWDLVPAAVSIGTAAALFAPALLEGLGNDFHNFRLYWGYARDNSRPYSWAALVEVAAATASPWRAVLGTLPGNALCGLALPAAVLSLGRIGWRQQQCLLFLLIALIAAAFAVGFAGYAGALNDYYLVILSPLPILFAASAPALVPPGVWRTAAVVVVVAVLVLPMPSHLDTNASWLAQRPDTFTHYEETLQVVERIATDAAGRRFGIHYQDQGHTDPYHYLYHFGTLALPFTHKVWLGNAVSRSPHE